MILGSEEALLWTLLRKFETDTLDRYRQYVPALAIAEKAEMVEELQRYSPTDEAPCRLLKRALSEPRMRGTWANRGMGKPRPL